MHSDSGHTTPIWTTDADVPTYPALAGDVTADVCVVGAGIAGLTTAYLLARAGRRVVVIDDGPIAGGETGRTTAHLASAMDDFYSEIEKVHGPGGARIAAESHSGAIDKVGEIAAAAGIDCDYRRLDGYLFLAKGDEQSDLEEELAAAHRAGLTGVEFVDRAPIASFDTGRCLRFPNQGQFHPVKYLAGLARAITRAGGTIHNGTHAEKITGGTPASVETTGGHTIAADAVVVATNSPVNDRVAMHTKQAPYRTYVIGARVPAGSVTPALYWDSADPYHYVRLEKGTTEAGSHDMLIVGGEDHKTGQADDAGERFRCLEEWTRARFPMAEEVQYRWSGQVMEPVDYMGFIGRNPGDENVFIVTGDSGQGTTHGTIAGMLITDLILGRPNEWEKLYDPSRKTLALSSVAEFAKENLNVARQYLDLVTPGEVDSPDDVKPGEGAVLRRGAQKVAVYRDPTGTVHERSAICTHLYCVVRWNHGEESWDCPCHGSRYDPYGRVVNGPAIADLPAAE